MDNKDYEYDNDKAFEDYEKTLLAIQRLKICEKIRTFVELNEDFGIIYACQIYEFLNEIEREVKNENDRND